MVKPFFFIFLLFFRYGWAMPVTGKEDFFFKHLEVEEGLAQQTVLTIFQDSDQYMWFGTRNGLSRYDGYEFKNYRKDYDDSRSLDDNYIQRILQDTARNIWVATTRSVNRIHYRTDQLCRYSFKEGRESEFVNTVFCTSGGRLLAFTTKANYEYHHQQDSFYRLDLPGNPRNVLFVLEDCHGNFYVTTKKQGIFVYDRQFVLKRHLQTEGYISYLFQENDRRIWMVHEGRKLYYYLTQEDRIVEYTGVKEVRQIIDWNERYLLVGTFQGLVLLDKQTLEPEGVDMKIGRQGGLSHYSILSLYKDRHGDLWVGTYSGGVNYYNKHNHRFNYITAHEFSGIIGTGAEDDDGVVWFATEGGGLLAYDKNRNTQKNYRVHQGQTGKYNQNIIKYLLLEGDQLYCTMHGAELYRFSIRDKKYHPLKNFGSGDICTLFRDSRKRLWIPTNTPAGLVVMDGKRQVDSLNLSLRYSELGVIVSILELEEKVFLFGTRTYGLFIYDERSGSFSRLYGKDLGLDSEVYFEVTCMLKDSDGDVWVATNGAGLFRFDGDMKLRKRFAKSGGLLDERVYGIVEHGEDIWLMCSHEFYRLDRRQDKLRRFYSIDGLMPAEFTVAGMFQGRDGKIYLPGTKGFLVIDPDVLTENDVKPPVVLTNLWIDNEAVVPSEKGSILQEKPGVQRKIVLKHNQTNLIVGYTALNYLYPRQNQYAYRMSGLEEKWNDVGGRRKAYYSNLKPGIYTFQVIASNNDDVWNTEGATLEIEVLSPFWRRWWAWGVYGLAIGFIVCLIIRSRHRKHELERSLHLKQLEQEKLRELAEERVRFFTYVTHEFRTPLTLIINPLNDLLQKYVHIAGVKDALLMVRRNAERLLSLVNSLMDMEKHQAGKVELNPVCFDFAVFVREMGHIFASIADSRHIRLVMETEPGYLPACYDRERLEPVFFNILSNAFKFTPEQGEVLLRAELLERGQAVEMAGGRPLKEGVGQWLFILVKDSGIGISADQTERVFEPFYQGGCDVHGQIRGSGVGLGIARAVIEQHEGIIFIRPQEKGTSVCILIPYQAASEEEMRDEWLMQEEHKVVDVADLEMFDAVSDKKVLLVEDHVEALNYLSSQLASEYTVLSAGNGAEAWKIITSEMPDMVVSDVMMPEMDGIELCTKIKEDVRFSHIPVILLTARSMQEQIEEGYKAGADDYIPKPFSISLLRIRMRNLFQNREQLKKIFTKKLALDELGFEIDKANRDFMERYVEIVRNNFRNPNLDAETIYTEMGMSRANFYRKLKSMTDLSSTEMIRNIRLESAAQLLRETKLNISEVAAQVGFSSNSYFGSCFKAMFGMSPKEYQNQ